MFGYVAPVLSVLNDEQRLRYRSLYCGVCHALKERHGQSGRLSLSNDMTFLAMLLSSLYEPETVQKDSRCGIHPLKKHSFCSSSMIDYAADMNALLFFWKCEDQRMDDAGDQRTDEDPSRSKHGLLKGQFKTALRKKHNKVSVLPDFFQVQ